MKKIYFLILMTLTITYSHLSCSGQQNPDTFLANFSAFAGGRPSLN
jgi:hypothetical protein